MTSYFLNRFSESLRSEINNILSTSYDFEVNEAHPKTGADLAVPLFSVAKELGKNPNELAIELSTKLQLDAATKIEPASGFLNIWLKPQTLAYELSQDIEKNNRYGFWPDLNKGKLALCEYPSPNMAKPFSVAHIRPSLQGYANQQLLKAVGYKTISDDHLGDTGRPFGMWVVGFQRYGSEERLTKNGAYELSECYIKINEDLKQEEAKGQTTTQEEVQSWIQKLEAGDQEALDYQTKFTTASKAHLEVVYKRLGISTDYALAESFYVKRGHKLADELLKSGIAQISDGAIIITLEEFGFDTPVMLRKSNGTSLYSATDLATLEYRDHEFKADEVFIHTGEEQNFYFRQLEALRQKLGYKGKVNHLWHGLVNQVNEDGTVSKMSSRKGVVYLENFLDKAEDIARSRVQGADTISDEDIKKISLGAVKFNDFTADRKNGTTFDWDTIFNLQGFSGPFVQYAGVRIKSILEKLDEDISEQNELNTDYDFQQEGSLLLMLAQYPEVVKKAAEKYEPHHLATYAFDLAKELNRYYEEVNIINSEDNEKEARVWLLKLTYQVLESSLGVLGIDIPNRM